MKKSPFLALFLALWAGACWAELTVGELQKLCSLPDEISKQSCKHYIIGAGLGYKMGIDNAGACIPQNLKICLPSGISENSIVTLVKIKMGELLAIYPADSKLEAVAMVSAVMTKNFKCSKQ